MTRDPRSDPQPGDRLSLGGTVRHVDALDLHWSTSESRHAVWWTVEGMTDERHCCSLAQWRRSMKAAEVLE